MAFDAPTSYSPPPQEPWSQGPPPRRGGFLTTLPGMLTATAGLITAVTGGVGLYLSHDKEPASGTVYNISVQGEPVPAGGGQVDMTGLGSGLPEASMDDEITALVNACLSGDAGACDTLLSLLADECYAGYGISCDVLFVISAPGSSLEAYGATCGGRFYDWAYAGVCSEL